MTNVLLLASSPSCLEDFGRLANRLREEEISPAVMTWPDANTSRLQKECEGKRLALIGIMGTPAELHSGFDALRAVSERCYRTAVAICLDAEGYKFYSRQKYGPDAVRIRFAVLVGEPEHFPHARHMIRVGGRRPHVQNEWSNDELENVTGVIVEELRLLKERAVLSA